MTESHFSTPHKNACCNQAVATVLTLYLPWKMSAGQQSCDWILSALSAVSLEQQRCYSPLRLLQHYPERNTDARAALLWQSNSHVTWQKRFNELQHTQHLAGRDVPNWHTLHTFAAETTSCPSIEVNWKLIRERLKRGGDTLCIRLHLMPVRLFWYLHGAQRGPGAWRRSPLVAVAQIIQSSCRQTWADAEMAFI